MWSDRFTLNPFEMKASSRFGISAGMTALYILLFRLTFPYFSSPTYAFLTLPAITITIYWGLLIGGLSTLGLFAFSYLILIPEQADTMNSLKASLIPPVTVFLAGIAAAASLRGLLKKIIEREREYRTIVSTAKSVIVKYDMEGKLTFFNRFAEELFGFSADDVIGKKGVETINHAKTPEERELMEQMLHELLINTEKYAYNENKNYREDGTEYWMAWTNAPVYNVAGKKIGIICIGNDITLQRGAELIVQQRLEEKDVLLREIHHRVKNNLQIISSILHLQEETLQSTEDIDIFKTCENRIASMALVHDHLYHSENIAQIDAEDYITALTGAILDSYSVSIDKLDLIYKVEPFSLNIDQAIPCGLILTELITNSMKHAIIPVIRTQKGELEITGGIKGTEVVLELRDNGPGLPAEFDLQQSDSLGLKLVDALVEQLNGKIKHSTTGDMKWILTFPKEEYRDDTTH